MADEGGPAATPESLGLTSAGLFGGGVIGGGWAARLLINGVDVQLFDPDPQAERKVDEMLANARRAWSSLTDAPLPAQGTLTRAATPAGSRHRRAVRAGERPGERADQALAARRPASEAAPMTWCSPARPPASCRACCRPT